MTINLIYQNFMTQDGKKMSIGGIQTYMLNLAEVAQSIGYSVKVYQLAGTTFECQFNGIEVRGYSYTGKKAPQYLLSKCMTEFNSEEDILIFACESYACKTKGIKCIAIQHGIIWDKPVRVGCNKALFLADYVYQAMKDWKVIRRVERVNHLICVDYNFLNWYRASVAYPRLHATVIPNFTEIADKELIKKHDKAKTIKILFARRFFGYRGTRIFGEAAIRILRAHKNIEIILAGSGPDEQWLRNQFSGWNNVSFITYESSESLKVHADIHIAVIPTVGSEGTSLSLLEAMSAQCAVICTNVGGMTNIVIDHYNGLMINPDEAALYQAMDELINNDELRCSLAEKAYDTVVAAFSRDAWQTKWKKILNEYKGLEE